LLQIANNSETDETDFSLWILHLQRLSLPFWFLEWTEVDHPINFYVCILGCGSSFALA
jgi:hypothetical protein